MIATAAKTSQAFKHSLRVIEEVGFWNVSAPFPIRDLEGMALDLYQKIKDEPPGFQREVCEKFGSLLLTMDCCTKWHHDRIFRDYLPFLEVGEPVRVWTLPEVYATAFPKWRARPFARIGTNTILYGEPGSQKSFWAHHYAMCVALGLEWCGFPTTRGRVLYVYGESNPGMQKLRQMAWNLANGYDAHADHDDQIRFVFCPINMADPNHVQLDSLIGEIEEFNPVVVINDTLNRSLNGNTENQAEVIGLYSNNLGILNRFGCDTVTIHHPGKNQAMRGSSALTGNFDNVAKLSRSANELTVTFEKTKDADDSVEMGFTTELIPLGIFDDTVVDEEPEEYKSCAVVRSRVVKKRRTKVEGGVMLSTNQWALLRALTETLGYTAWLKRIGKSSGGPIKNDMQKLVDLGYVHTAGKGKPYTRTPAGDKLCEKSPQEREV